MAGMFIVLDGADGSGKATQTKLLAERLTKEGFSVNVADFPQYGNWSAAFVERYLRGEFGSSEKVKPKQASLFYALDRFAAKDRIRQWLQEGHIVISNRYVSANKGHQLGKVQGQKQRQEFLDWINKIEYGILEIPPPDITIFLHVPAELAQQLVDKKDSREYLQGKKRDIHEDDLHHLKNAEEAYLFCLEHDSQENWKKITCWQGSQLNMSQLKTKEAVHQEIYALVRPYLSNQ